MGEARGVVSKEELKAYSGANIMLLDGGNDSTGSGIGEATGSETYTWTIRWNSSGFMGIGWEVSDYDDYYNFSGTYETSGDSGVLGIFNTYDTLGVELANAMMSQSAGFRRNGCLEADW